MKYFDPKYLLKVLVLSLPTLSNKTQGIYNESNNNDKTNIEDLISKNISNFSLWSEQLNSSHHQTIDNTIITKLSAITDKHSREKRRSDLKSENFSVITATKISMKYVPLDLIRNEPPDNIKNLLPDQLQGFTPEQLQVLTSEQLQVLTTKQLQAFRPNQLRALTSDQIQALTLPKIKTLSKGQIQALTSEQLQDFTSEQIQALTLDQLQSLLSYEIQALTEEQKNIIDRILLIKNISNRYRRSISRDSNNDTYYNFFLQFLSIFYQKFESFIINSSSKQLHWESVQNTESININNFYLSSERKYTSTKYHESFIERDKIMINNLNDVKKFRSKIKKPKISIDEYAIQNINNLFIEEKYQKKEVYNKL